MLSQYDLIKYDLIRFQNVDFNNDIVTHFNKINPGKVDYKVENDRKYVDSLKSKIEKNSE